MNNPWLVAIVLCGAFYLIVVWIETEAKQIMEEQRSLIQDLIAENNSLRARLKLHGIDTKEKDNE